MKRAFGFILTVLLLISLALPACALGTNTYTDRDTGNQLSFPSDWKIETKDDSLSKVKFIPPSGTTALMQYGSADIWASLPASEKEKIPRSDCDNSKFSKSDIAEFLGTEANVIKEVTLGGRDYFCAEMEKTIGQGSIKLTLSLTYWVRLENGWFYLYQFSGNKDSSLYDQFTDMIFHATYGDKSVPDTPSNGGSDKRPGSGSDAEIYADAVRAYNSGSYYDAMTLFETIRNYQDSSKYLRLIRIRNSGSNCGMGAAVYNSSCGLTSAQQADIDAAARDFYFADTASVLLCNSDVACYYLRGKWSGGAKCYIEFYENKKAGYSYYIGSKLSTNYKDTYSINSGDLRVDILATNKLTLSMTLTAPNCMDVYSHEKGNCYTLTRK